MERALCESISFLFCELSNDSFIHFLINSLGSLPLCVKVKVTQSCLTLCDPMDCSPPCSSIHGIFQARILKLVAISFSRGSSQPRDQICVSCIGRWIFFIESPGKPTHQGCWPVTFFSCGVLFWFLRLDNAGLIK